MSAAAVSLGLDLGTSELKAALFDAAGQVLGSARVALATGYPRSGWSEQSPQSWWHACRTALANLRAQAPHAFARTACVGLSGQMHGAVLLDAAGAVLRPAILWNDSRAAPQAALLNEQHPGFAAALGSRPMAGFVAPKLLWLREHEPQLFGRIGCVLSPKDYLRWRLTGARVTDMSDASGTLLLDAARRDWHEGMVRACGLSAGQLPRLVEGDAAAGHLLAPVARELGLPPDIVVAGGAGDNPAAAVGLGLREAGQSFATLGTSAAMVVMADRHAFVAGTSTHSFCHALPQRWYVMGAMLAGASCLEWFAGLARRPVAELVTQVERTVALERPPASDLPLFLPYLSGERTPHDAPWARGGFMQLAARHGDGELGYAVLEGVCFGLRDAMLEIERTVVPRGDCLLVGGGSRSRYWAQLLAHVLGRPIALVPGSELAACRGAALLALAAIGHAPAGPAAPTERFEPDREVYDALTGRYEAFRGLFAAVRGVHERLSHR